MPSGTDQRFAFGANWRDFASDLQATQIAAAETSLTALLPADELSGRSFVDMGSGSGLSSLVALKLGASRVHAFDYDENSVETTRGLLNQWAPGGPWRAERGDVLDRDYVEGLGKFDVVYSWGVLHHTGDMWTAIDNAASAVADGGWLFLAIYNDQGGKSRRWKAKKRLYNQLPRALRKPYAAVVIAPTELKAFAAAVVERRLGGWWRSWRDPSTRRRGMSRSHDILDWVGGYPFEVAKPEEVVEFLMERGFALRRMTTMGGSWGCNQFLLQRA